MTFMRENAILLDSERHGNAKGGAITPQQAFFGHGFACV
jgi:hypothetical protein